jgi:hypothetical protein
MESLPIDVLPLIFSYVDANTCLRCKFVNRRWRRVAGKGCVFLHVKYGTTNMNVIGSVTLVASREAESDIETTDIARKRTRGHLPEPSVLPVGERQDSQITIQSHIARENKHGPGVLLDGESKKHDGFAFRLELNEQTKFTSLDLALSTFQRASRACSGQKRINGVPHPGPLRDVIEETSRKLNKAVEDLSLAGLRHLQRLSVRGCSSLRSLHLPPSLVALDASGCTSLRHISVPNEVELVAVNLNGCRSLEPRGEGALFGPSTEHAMRRVQQVDMSGVNPSCSSAIADALRFTTCLEILSLRYVATDDILLALAESESARTSLRLLDVAFSTELTDVAVETLVQSAPNLERFNLRGCKKVSVECYNKTPVLLMNRYNSTNNIQCVDDDPETNGDRKARKGDNIFSFTAVLSKCKKLS